MANKEAAPPKLIAVTEAAVNSIGLGFDMVMDCRLEYGKNPDGLRLIDICDDRVRDLAVPGGISVPNVPECIKCGKGDRMRFRSDVLSFQQMSEHFNQEMSLSGKIPTGHFNAAFEFTGQWQKDAAYTRALAFDGVYITLYSVELEKSQMVLSEHVKQAVPLTWDPVALTKFIGKYGTHIVTGVKVGGKEVVYVKQHHSSHLQADGVQKRLKDVADKRFSCFTAYVYELFLTADKPPIEALHQFLDFQVAKKWAPVYGELSLVPVRKQQSIASLQFSFLGPKLYVNTDLVDAGKNPVTGARLYLEGRRSNCLAIHLQHLSSCPKSFQLLTESTNTSGTSFDQSYHEKVRWKMFSHVCTAPVESDDDLSIVTGAQFQVKKSGLHDVLFLLLQFSRATGSLVMRKQEWSGVSDHYEKSGLISSLISSISVTSQKEPPKPSDININSALYPEGPPVPAAMRELLRFVDTKEMTRGPLDPPGFWVVSGARLVIEKGKICLSIKYSLLTMDLPVEEIEMQG
ncbi:hypothetical protein DH2020_037850 [Rehmannia glutinosa]|uniref:MACPF domain-containing protein n=1 Tax=Rehmannia glutinosa TaxID=99300 RepID=A0ABR0V1G9_REHGL